MNDTVNDKKGHNNVNDSFAYNTSQSAYLLRMIINWIYAPHCKVTESCIARFRTNLGSWLGDSFQFVDK